MSSVHAKLFEWHRVIQDIVAAEAELKDVAGWPKADRDQRLSEVTTRVTLMRCCVKSNACATARRERTAQRSGLSFVQRLP